MSVGIASRADNKVTAGDHLVALADAALYEAKGRAGTAA